MPLPREVIFPRVMRNHDVRALLLGAGEQILDLVCDGATVEQLAEWLRAPLKHAATAGDLDLTTRLLDVGASGNALSAAIRGGHVELIGDLLHRMASSTEQDEHGDAPIHVATSLGYDKVVRDLLEAGVSPSEKAGGVIPPFTSLFVNAVGKLYVICWRRGRAYPSGTAVTSSLSTSLPEKAMLIS